MREAEKARSLRSHSRARALERLRGHGGRRGRCCGPEVEQRYQERLTQRLIGSHGDDFNRQRLLEEVAVLVDRSDIAEELRADAYAYRTLCATCSTRAERSARSSIFCCRR